VKNSVRTTFRRAATFAAMTAVMAVLGVATPASADTLNQYLNNVASVQHGSLVGTYNVITEYALINAYSAQYLAQQAAANVPAVGVATLNGEYPAHIFNRGDTASLNFEFVDPATGQPLAGPPVDRVDYYINTDPQHPNVYTLFATAPFAPGTGDGHGANVTFSDIIEGGGGEAEIEAVPIGPNGPIFIPGNDGSNVAQGFVSFLVPEPASWLLLGIGALLLGLLKWGKARKV